MNEKNTDRGAGKSPSFRERMTRLDDIAQRIADIAEVTDDGSYRDLMADSAFLREEAVRMAAILKRFAEKDGKRPQRFPRKEARRQ